MKSRHLRLLLAATAGGIIVYVLARPPASDPHGTAQRDVICARTVPEADAPNVTQPEEETAARVGRNATLIVQNPALWQAWRKARTGRAELRRGGHGTGRFGTTLPQRRATTPQKHIPMIPTPTDSRQSRRDHDQQRSQCEQDNFQTEGNLSATSPPGGQNNPPAQRCSDEDDRQAQSQSQCDNQGILSGTGGDRDARSESGHPEGNEGDQQARGTRWRSIEEEKADLERVTAGAV